MKQFIRNASLAFVSLCLFLSSSAYAKTITLNFATQNSKTSWGSVHALRPWIKQVEKATGGEVTFRVFYSQTLAPGKEAWKAVKNRIADVAWCFHGYWPGLTPLADVVSLPGLNYNSAEKGSEILWKTYSRFPEIQKEFNDNKILLLYTSNPYILITKDKPVNTLEDIRGMKIRVTGGPPTDQMKALGGVPLLIPMPDTYIALQKGVIDGMGAPWEAIHGFRLHEVVNHYTEVPFSAVYFSIAMNKAVWNKLSRTHQEAIMSVSGLQGSKFWGASFFDSAKTGVREEVSKAGKQINIKRLSQSEIKRWTEVSSKPIWERWIKNMDRKGHRNAREILESVLQMH
ncbi:MAG: TRAP transporter substrate-binding protein [Proteobacteria bacterium]|nr:TRAP transporter substrate-binding protein [Pseudomonadota bacterium]